MFPQRSSVTYRTPAFYKPPPSMELASNLEYPNLNVSDMNARLENLSPRLHDCWDSISMNETGHFALATNRREGTRWWGMFFGYQQLQHMTVDNADYKLQSDYVVNFVRYATDNMLFVALGDARLQLWSTYSSVRNPKSPYCLFLIGEATAHRTPINNLCVFGANKHQAVTTCLESSVNVWDLSGADLCTTYSARVASVDKLTGLATPVSTDKQFLTCDRIGCARLWDVRASSLNSSKLFDDDALSFTCATWAASTELQGDNHIYLGDYDGNVHTLDLRMPHKLLQTAAYFEQGHVAQLLINGKHLAATSNLPSGVKIEQIDGNRRFVYTNENTHTRCTDAVWKDEHTLLTIGHGHKMATHKI